LILLCKNFLKISLFLGKPLRKILKFLAPNPLRQIVKSINLISCNYIIQKKPAIFENPKNPKFFVLEKISFNNVTICVNFDFILRNQFRLFHILSDLLTQQLVKNTGRNIPRQLGTLLKQT
jgi:hypothetical protein